MKQAEKQNEVEEELVKESVPTNTRKGVLKSTNKYAKKSFDSETRSLIMNHL